MALHSWRRLHRDRLIAEVEPVPGFVTWAVSVWVKPDPASRITLDRHFELLTTAQAAADHILRQQFKHRCDRNSCGEWWPADEA